tara:strand:+ start:215 stop:385 length:171 start_codon:yes stop_codon:yes gene_type:complete
MTDEEWAQEKAMNKLGLETRNFRADGTIKHTLENQKRYAYKAAERKEKHSENRNHS